MTELFAGAALGALVAWAVGLFVLIRTERRLLDAFAEERDRTELRHYEERESLTAKLAVRTAAPGPEQAAQVRLARPAPGPSRELSDEEYRKANRNVSPLGL